MASDVLTARGPGSTHRWWAPSAPSPVSPASSAWRRQRSTWNLSADRALSEAVTPGPLGAVLDLKVTSGSLSHFGPGDVALSTLIAGKGAMDVHVGQAITRVPGGRHLLPSAGDRDLLPLCGLR